MVTLNIRLTMKMNIRCVNVTGFGVYLKTKMSPEVCPQLSGCTNFGLFILQSLAWQEDEWTNDNI